MGLKDIISKLQVGNSAKGVVYVSVTPGVGLEMIQLDTSTKTVMNYSYRPLEYKETLREIQDIKVFKVMLEELFEELGINPKSDVVLNVPLVLFGKKDLPLILSDEAISEALISEVEQSYIFKRNDPEISWVDVNNPEQQLSETRKLLYSAIQKTALDEIKEAFEEIGSHLIGIEVSLISVLKALAFTGLTADQMQDGVIWNLMLVTQNGYSVCSMKGKEIVDYYEEPLAIKSFENDEIYNALNASAQMTLMNYPTGYLYVVSETDLVSAEVLAAKLTTEGTVAYYENNEFRKENVIDVGYDVLADKARKISLEIIGVATGNKADLPAVFNFIDENEAKKTNDDELVTIEIGHYKFSTTPNVAKNISMLVALALIVPVAILALVCPMLVNSKQVKYNDVVSKYDAVEAQVARYEKRDKNVADFNVNTEIENVLASNRTKLMGYSALGEAIPRSVWLTYFVAQEDGKFDIKGESTGVEDIYAFYKNMKDSLINTKLKLHKLEMKESSVEDAVSSDTQSYEFELTNMDNPEALQTSQQDLLNNGDNAASPATDEKPALKTNSNFLLSPINELNQR